MSEADHLSLRTENDIWRTAEKMCARLQEMGVEAMFLSFNKERETTTYRTSQESKIFLQKNPNSLENFKNHFRDSKTSEKKEIEKTLISEKIATEVEVTHTKDEPDADELMDSKASDKDAIEEKTTSEYILPEVKVHQITESSDDEDSGDSSDTEMLSDWNVEDDRGSSMAGYSSDEKKVSLSQSPSAEFPNDIQKEKRFSCDVCKRTYARKTTLNHHKKVHEQGKQVKNFPCVMCGKGFETFNDLQQHLCCHDNVKSFKCEICNKFFRQKNNLLIHQVKKHKGSEPFKCRHCGKSFPSSSNLKAHICMRIHNSNKCFRCNVCGETYDQHGDFVIHECDSRNESQLECHYEDCGKKFSRKSLLRKHQKSHSRVKPFLCSTCGKAFRQKNKLATHERVHTGDKPYLCQICGKMFSDSSNLRTHKKTHTGQRYYCSTCNKCFVYKTGLNRHEKSCTGKNEKVNGDSEN